MVASIEFDASMTGGSVPALMSCRSFHYGVRHVFCGLYWSVVNYLSDSSLQGIGPARQPAALDLEAANCLDLRFVSDALLWFRG